MQSGIPLNAPPYDARALANSILQDAYQFNIDLYSTSMLKILYFAHGWYLARFNTPLIGQPFEAWKHGPVIRVIYDQLKGMSGRKIERRFEIFDAVTKQYIAPEAHLTDADRSFIKFMLRAYSQFHPYELSEMTHEVNSLGTRCGKLDQVEVRLECASPINLYANISLHSTNRIYFGVLDY